MTVDASHYDASLSRRTLLRTAASATVGLAGILATKTPPLYAATRTVTMLAGQPLCASFGREPEAVGQGV